MSANQTRYFLNFMELFYSNESALKMKSACFSSQNQIISSLVPQSLLKWEKIRSSLFMKFQFTYVRASFHFLSLFLVTVCNFPTLIDILSLPLKLCRVVVWREGS